MPIMQNPKIIAISGVARSGKNTFANLLHRKLGYEKCVFGSFAASLRFELNEYLKPIGLDVYSEENEMKNLVRPIMVHYAAKKRLDTKGEYFVKNLDKEYKAWSAPYFIVTDLRFGYYYDWKTNSGDEIGWVKQNNGVIIHISKYDTKTNCFLEPVNEQERINDPIVRSFADFHIEWPDVGQDNLAQLEEYVNHVKI